MKGLSAKKKYTCRLPSKNNWAAFSDDLIFFRERNRVCFCLQIRNEKRIFLLKKNKSVRELTLI